MVNDEKPRCVVFGATGRLLVERFSELGFQVVAVGRSRERL